MKKLIALLLAALMLLALAACGNTASTDSAASTEATGEASKMTADEAAKFHEVFGSYEEKVYTNTYLKLTVTLEDKWTSYSDDKLLSENGLTADGTLAEQLNAASVLELMCAEKESGEAMSINAETLDGAMTEVDYLAAQIDALKAELESIGLEQDAITLEQSTVTFAGAEHACLNVSVVIDSSSTLHQAVIAYAFADGKMAVVSVSAWDADSLNTLVGSFSQVG